MEEIFDSEYFTAEYDKDSEVAILTWKKYEEVDNFRTPLMQAADMVRRHNSDVLIVDRSAKIKVSDKDQNWVSKIFITALKQSGCKKVIVITPKEEFDVTKYPFDVISKKFELERADSVEAAIKKLLPESSMTLEQALDYMGLPHDATPYVIDEKFWQMSKVIRSQGGDDYEAKLDELSDVYDIASGRKGTRDKAIAARNRKRKYFGKTSDEWRTHFSYSWFKYLVILVAAIAIGNILYTMIFKPRIDCGIVSIGHFTAHSEYYEKLLMEEMGFKNAYINFSDVVVPNSEGQNSVAYSEQSASTMLISQPNLVVTDSITTPYYFSSYSDMSETYEMLRHELSSEEFSKLKPVYLSEREYYYLLIEAERANGFNDSVYDNTLGEYSPEIIMIGIEVDDPEYMESVGYECYWHDESVRLVFSIFSDPLNYEDSQRILLNILQQTL